MVAVENILQNKFGSSKNLPIFAMRNVLKSLDSRTHIIRAVAFHKAEFPLIQSRFGDFGRFAKTSRELRSFVIHINQIFSYQMRNVAKNLTQTPKVCSVSTSNARKSVTSKSVTITPNLLYQITMKLTVSSDGADGRVRRCGVIHTDIYQAASENEAMGLALTTVRGKYGAFYDIDLHSITRERTYRAIQQQSQQPQHPWQR